MNWRDAGPSFNSGSAVRVHMDKFFHEYGRWILEDLGLVARINLTFMLNGFRRGDGGKQARGDDRRRYKGARQQIRLLSGPRGVAVVETYMAAGGSTCRSYC